MKQPVVIDAAGATAGGARRFLLELQDYRQRHPDPSVRLIGGDNLTPQWLLRREFLARDSAKIALNNASFVGGAGQRTVLLRNALHFASDSEFAALGYQPSTHMRRQIPVIRALARRADRIVVPTDAMAGRVAQCVPALSSRIEVRMHPVSPRGWAGQSPDEEPIILVPIVPQSYKRLDLHVPALLRAVAGSDLKVAVTASPGDIPPADGHSNYLPLGTMPAEKLAHWWGRARAVFFPPTLESFGYALAEARCGGRPVIAPDTAQNQQIAGPALCGYSTAGQAGAGSQAASPAQLAHAVAAALRAKLLPDPAPFDPDRYFNWLIDGSR